MSDETNENDEVIKKGKPKTDKGILTLARKRFKIAEEAEADTRKKQLEELKFRAGDQWPDNLKQERQMQSRPCLTINQLPKFVRQVTNEARQNRPSIKFLPTADATQEQADIRNGMARHILADSQADVAFDTACDQQASIGLGYFRVITEYCNERSFNQDIKIKRIKNPFTVYFDPNAQEHDYSDAKYCFITSDMAREEFLNTYKDDVEDLSDYTFQSTGDEEADWSGEETIRVAEYFFVEEEPATIYEIENEMGRQVVDEKEKKQLEDAGIGFEVINERQTTFRKIKWAIITASEILDMQEWPGKYIPVIPVLGEDYDINGKRVIRGMVSDAMDPQRQYNYHSSAFTEAIALAPKAPYVMAEGQDEGYERFWDNANNANYSRLVYKPVTVGGQVLGAPRRETAEPPVQALSYAIRQSAEDLKGTTGIYDAGLGARSNEQSGRAILARQQEGDTSNFHYFDNLARAVRYLGIILDDLIPRIYDTERVIRILQEDEESKLVKINAYMTSDEGDGYIENDMTKGEYDVQVGTGPSFTTKRQEAAANMTNIVQAYPRIMEVGGDIMIRNQDWPGADELAERLKKTIPPELTQEDEEGAPQIPPEMQKQLQQQDMMIKDLTEALNATQQIIDNKMEEIASKERMKMAELENKVVLQMTKQTGDANMEIMKKHLEEINTRLDVLGQNAPLQPTEDSGMQQTNQNRFFGLFR